MLLDERLFCQTVTVYRCQDQQLLRMEIPNCHMHLQSTLVPHVTGSRIRKDFTLIVPGQADVMPGDLIYHGIGPEVTMDTWAEFVPAAVAPLVQAEYVQPVYCGGTVHHTQAGSMRRNWR